MIKLFLKKTNSLSRKSVDTSHLTDRILLSSKAIMITLFCSFENLALISPFTACPIKLGAGWTKTTGKGILASPTEIRCQPGINTIICQHTKVPELHLFQNSQTISSADLESGRHNTFNRLDSLQHYKDQFTWNSKTWFYYVVCKYQVLCLCMRTSHPKFLNWNQRQTVACLEYVQCSTVLPKY